MTPDALPQALHGAKVVTMQDILRPILLERKKIVTVSVLVAAATLAVNFLLPVYYKSTATLLPETQKDKLSALGQFADIASLAGVSVPGSEIARLYPTIVNSETVLRTIITRKYRILDSPDSVNLIQYFGYTDDSPQKNAFDTIEKMRGLLTATHENKTSVVTLSVEMPEPELAAAVLNAIIGELDGFMRSKRVTNAGEQVKWIDVRLKEVEHEMKHSEEKLKDFRERNRRVSDSPTLLLEQERLVRDVQVRGTVFIELKKQYEIAKLEEIKNISIVNVLDPGRAPVKKERPRRATNTLLAMLLSGLVTSAWIGGKAIYGDRLLALRSSLSRKKA